MAKEKSGKTACKTMQCEEPVLVPSDWCVLPCEIATTNTMTTNNLATDAGASCADEPRPSQRSARRQCTTCPWRVSVNPRDIGGGYGYVLPEMVARYTPSGQESLTRTIHVATCHEAAKRLPCVGWLVHQMGPGNNLAVRLAVLRGSLDANVRVVGEQRDLPKELKAVEEAKAEGVDVNAIKPPNRRKRS